MKAVTIMQVVSSMIDSFMCSVESQISLRNILIASNASIIQLEKNGSFCNSPQINFLLGRDSEWLKQIKTKFLFLEDSMVNLWRMHIFWTALESKLGLPTINQHSNYSSSKCQQSMNNLLEAYILLTGKKWKSYNTLEILGQQLLTLDSDQILINNKLTTI